MQSTACWPWDSREHMLQTIRDSACYIAENAENLLGEYPGAALNEMTISIRVIHGEVPIVNVSRDCIGALPDKHPNFSEAREATTNHSGRAKRMQADVPTRDELRDEFNASWSYDDINESDIYALESLLILECLNPGDHMKMHLGTVSIQMRHSGVNGTRQHDEGLLSAFLRVDGPYFTDREAISFNDDGFIGFCRWADSHNSMPILKAFSDWVRIYLPTRCVAIVGASAEGAEAGDGQ